MSMNPAQRIAKWDAKFNTLDESRSRMFANVQNVFPQITSMEEQVRQTLDPLGVSMIQYPYYLCFGREVWALQRRGVSGNSLAIEVETLIAKWVARNLTRSVLEAIRTQVFNVGPPPSP